MATPKDILAGNLKEALKEAQRYIAFGTTAALFLLLLVVQDWLGGGEKNIKVPFVEVSADRALAEVIAGVAYFISGYLANLSIHQARRIMMRLRSAPQLREALLTYPSIPTIDGNRTRIAALFLPILIFLASTVPFFFIMTGKNWRGLVLMALFLSVPWVTLILELRRPLSEIKDKLSDPSLKQLRDSGVGDDVDRDN